MFFLSDSGSSAQKFQFTAEASAEQLAAKKPALSPSKIKRLETKEAKEHARAAAKAGLGGLTPRELAFGAFFAEKEGALFKYLPDPVEAVSTCN